MRDFLKFSLRYGKIYDKIKTTEEEQGKKVLGKGYVHGGLSSWRWGDVSTLPPL